MGVVLVSNLNFNTHIDQKVKTCDKMIGLPRNALLTIYESFIRPQLDYGDMLYDKSNNENVQNNDVLIGHYLKFLANKNYVLFYFILQIIL